MFRWLKDLLRIYSWTEFWLLLTVPTSIVGVWFVFSLLLSTPIIIRNIAIWSMFLVLFLGGATVDFLVKKQGAGTS